MSYLFTPPSRTMTVVIYGRGGLKYSYPVVFHVWKDGTGTWIARESPSDADLLNAQKIAALGRPTVVDDATAAELTAAGIGTLVHL